MLQAKQGDVVVHAPAVVVRVFKCLNDVSSLLGSLQPVALIVACRQKAAARSSELLRYLVSG